MNTVTLSADMVRGGSSTRADCNTILLGFLVMSALRPVIVALRWPVLVIFTADFSVSTPAWESYVAPTAEPLPSGTLPVLISVWV